MNHVLFYGLLALFVLGATAESHLAADFTHILYESQITDHVLSYFNDVFKCTVCRYGISILLHFLQQGYSDDFFVSVFFTGCSLIGYKNEFCTDLITSNMVVLLYIARHKTLTANRVCELILQSSYCDAGIFDWTVRLPKGQSRARNAPQQTAPLKILHFSDTHLDLNYTVGGLSKCSEPICCQPEYGLDAGNGTPCQYWGMYHTADAPWQLIEAFANQAQGHEITYAYFTGDLMSHRVWDTSIERHRKVLTKQLALFKEQLKVPIFPVLGNHDTHPLNLWVPFSVRERQFTNRGLYESTSALFSLLIGENVEKTMLAGGYYTVSPRPGFRVVTLNTNFCNIYNFWLLYDDSDALHQLNWLVRVLHQAEKDNESVHILMHMPPAANDTLKVCAREYQRIVERFSNTITGQFAGHTHLDEFQVFYTEDVVPTGAIFNGASITPHIANNPSYKVFDVHPEDFSLQDFEQWTFNLTLANLNATAALPWYKLYKFSDIYEVQNLSSVELNKVVFKMLDNTSLVQNYYLLKSRKSDAVPVSCNAKCLRSNICEITSAVFGNRQPCESFLSLYDIKT